MAAMKAVFVLVTFGAVADVPNEIGGKQKKYFTS